MADCKLNVSIKHHFTTVIESMQEIHEISESWNKYASIFNS